ALPARTGRWLRMPQTKTRTVPYHRLAFRPGRPGRRARRRRLPPRPACGADARRHALPGPDRRGPAYPGRDGALRHPGLRWPGSGCRSPARDISMGLLYPLRIALFYFLLAFSAFAWCLVCLVCAPFMSFRMRYRFVVQNWCRCAVWLGRSLIGLRYQVQGTENIPTRPCVILAKHQSTWETFFLSAYFEPLTQVLKRELLRVPF